MKSIAMMILLMIVLLSYNTIAFCDDSEYDLESNTDEEISEDAEDDTEDNTEEDSEQVLVKAKPHAEDTVIHDDSFRTFYIQKNQVLRTFYSFKAAGFLCLGAVAAGYGLFELGEEGALMGANPLISSLFYLSVVLANKSRTDRFINDPPAHFNDVAWQNRFVRNVGIRGHLKVGTSFIPLTLGTVGLFAGVVDPLFSAAGVLLLARGINRFVCGRKMQKLEKEYYLHHPKMESGILSEDNPVEASADGDAQESDSSTPSTSEPIKPKTPYELELERLDTQISNSKELIVFGTLLVVAPTVVIGTFQTLQNVNKDPLSKQEYLPIAIGSMSSYLLGIGSLVGGIRWKHRVQDEKDALIHNHFTDSTFSCNLFFQWNPKNNHVKIGIKILV